MLEITFSLINKLNISIPLAVIESPHPLARPFLTTPPSNQTYRPPRQGAWPFDELTKREFKLLEFGPIRAVLGVPA